MRSSDIENPAFNQTLREETCGLGRPWFSGNLGWFAMRRLRQLTRVRKACADGGFLMLLSCREERQTQAH